jgi:hypothetical protein
VKSDKKLLTLVTKTSIEVEAAVDLIVPVAKIPSS